MLLAFSGPMPARVTTLPSDRRSRGPRLPRPPVWTWLVLLASAVVMSIGNGGIIGPRNAPSSSAAPGVWTLEEAQQHKQAGNWPRTPYDIEYLIVGGGGSGGGSTGDGYRTGGGGAGGYRTGTLSVTSASPLSVTVGAGGPAPSATLAQGNDGAASVFGAVSAAGGGGGGGGKSDAGATANGRAGGSGGGGGSSNSGSGATAGAGNTPSTSPAQGSAGGTGNSGGTGAAAGGGGSGGTGANAATNAAGGIGTSNSITGGAITYAVGGKGGASSPAAGAANTGNGGDGIPAAGAQAGMAGGSGVVILRMPTANYTGVVTGSPTVTTDGSFTVVKFTASGSYTPYASSRRGERGHPTGQSFPTADETNRGYWSGLGAVRRASDAAKEKKIMADSIDQAGARKIATHAADRFLVENEGGTVRLSFGEGWQGQTTYHASHRLSLADAIELHAVLGDVLSAKGEKPPS